MTENAVPHSSRVRGAIVGVCVGDALGGPVQFKARGSFEPVTDFRPLEHFDKPAGSWSDDGSLTLCLAQSLIDHHPEWNAHDCARNFTRWYTDGYYSTTTYPWDVGNSTSIALDTWKRVFYQEEKDREGWKFRALGTWRKASHQKEKEDQRFQEMRDYVASLRVLNHNQAMGNGSLMRCSPAGLVFHEDEEKAVRVAREQSALTHPRSQCQDACEVYARLLCSVIKGASKEALVKTLASMHIADDTLRSRLEPHQTLDDWRSLTLEDIRSSGWVVDTLEAALWAFFTTDDWTSGALNVVNLGGDADTVGAVYGGLAGAFYGLEAIPEKWRGGIVKTEMVHDVATKLAECSTS